MFIPSNIRGEILVAVIAYQDYADALKTTEFRIDGLSYMEIYLRCGELHRALSKRGNIKHSLYIIARRATMWHYSQKWDVNSDLFKWTFPTLNA